MEQSDTARPGEGHLSVVPAGWTRDGWVNHLRHIAEACEKVRPERAKELNNAAEKIENKKPE